MTLAVALVLAILILPPSSPLSVTSEDDDEPVVSASPTTVSEGAPASTSVPALIASEIATPSIVQSVATPTVTPLAPVQQTPTPTTKPTSIPTITATVTPQPVVEPTTGSTPTPVPADAVSPGLSEEELESMSVDELISLTEHSDWTVRWDAVNQLGVMKAPEALPALAQRALYDDNTHPQWRSLWAISAIDPTGGETVPIFVEAALSNDLRLVHYAGIALAFFDRPEGEPALIASLGSTESFRRWEAVFSLRNVASQAGIEAIIPLLDTNVESDTGVRGEVALTLGNVGGEQAVPVLMATLRSDPSAEVRWRAALGLSVAGDASLLSELEVALADEQDDQVRETIQQTIDALR